MKHDESRGEYFATQADPPRDSRQGRRHCGSGRSAGAGVPPLLSGEVMVDATAGHHRRQGQSALEGSSSRSGSLRRQGGQPPRNMRPRGEVVEDVRTSARRRKVATSRSSIDRRDPVLAFRELKCASAADWRGGWHRRDRRGTGDCWRWRTIRLQPRSATARGRARQMRNARVTDTVEPGSTLKPSRSRSASRRGQGAAGHGDPEQPRYAHHRQRDDPRRAPQGPLTVAQVIRSRPTSARRRSRSRWRPRR